MPAYLMRPLAMPDRLSQTAQYLDLDFQHTPCLIAAAVLETPEGLLVIDPGPSSTRAMLEIRLAETGARLQDVHALLLTHIHLDHAGAAGSLARDHPDLKVYVHQTGARHLAQPAGLIRSARRLYQEQMDTLWGEVLPVPEAQLIPLSGGEHLMFGNRSLEIAYTPGHAIHHLSFLDPTDGIAYVGDTTGMRVAGAGYLMPVTPPPDIDLAAWRQSLDQLQTWQPDRLFLTHFGPSDAPDDHLATFEASLKAWGMEVRADLDRGMPDAEAAEHFGTVQLERMRKAIPPAHWPPYEIFGLPEASWYGLARYWRKLEQE